MSFATHVKASRDLLTERNFGLLLLGQLVSQLGENLNKVALLWFVYLFTKSAEAMIVVGVPQTLPPMLFFWANGVLLDRYPKRRTMIIVDAVRGLLVLLIPSRTSKNTPESPGTGGISGSGISRIAIARRKIAETKKVAPLMTITKTGL